jgi:hypothetical protein
MRRLDEATEALRCRFRGDMARLQQDTGYKVATAANAWASLRQAGNGQRLIRPGRR